MKIFIGMETSGQMRRRLQVMGHDVISCDMLPAGDGVGKPVIRDGRSSGGHIQGDVFAALDLLASLGWVPDAGQFHPTCTMHVVSAAWAFLDPDFDRYPGVGYHQKVRPGTLTGADRRLARDAAEIDLERIRLLPFFKVVENPRGTIPTRTRYGRPADVLQPHEFGDDASKATCIWAFDADGNSVPLNIPRDHAKLVPPTLRANGKAYWANQTDTGQNRASPSDDRWQGRSKTYDGIADALSALLTSPPIAGYGLSFDPPKPAYSLSRAA